MIWDADACNLHLEMLVMQKVLNHENCVMLMTFFPIFCDFDFDLIFFASFFSFCGKHRLTVSFCTARKRKALGSIVRPIEGWQWIVTLWYVTKWKFPDRVMPRVCRSRWSLMTWADHEIIYITKLPLDSKGIPRSLHERLTSYVPYYPNCLYASSTSSWSNEFSSQMCKCEPQGFSCFLYILYSFCLIH